MSRGRCPKTSMFSIARSRRRIGNSVGGRRGSSGEVVAAKGRRSGLAENVDGREITSPLGRQLRDLWDSLEGLRLLKIPGWQ